MEPDSDGPDDERQAEEDRERGPAAAPPERKRDGAADQERRGACERQPGYPDLAEHFAVLEPDLDEEERRAQEQRGDEHLVDGP